jgi:hypothetical protein
VEPTANVFSAHCVVDFGMRQKLVASHAWVPEIDRALIPRSGTGGKDGLG